ncbi:hypothetical protein B0H12DRAFT_1069556 [Mycena haematopus]|nr:hypothetical protein B0H12DRAFT_1069556 [Mycena haematopus]
MHHGLFQSVDDWNFGRESFGQSANAILLSDRSFNSAINPSRNGVTVHSYFTGFANLQPGDITISPEKSLHENQPLISRDRRRHLQGFLHMHPELVWYAEKINMSPHTFLTRLSYLIGEHMHDISTTSSGVIGIRNSDLDQLYHLGSIDEFDLRRLATNPMSFLAGLPRLIPHTLVTEHEKRLVRLLLAHRPYYVSDAINEKIPPRTFVIALLCFVRTLPEYTNILLDSLPPLSEMYNMQGYYRSGSVISISSSRAPSMERSYLDSNPLHTPLSDIFDDVSVLETTNLEELELKYPQDSHEEPGEVTRSTPSPPLTDPFEHQYHAFIYPFEHDFLAEAANVLKSSTYAKGRALSVLIPQLLATRFEHHSEMSHLLSAGILGTVGKVDIFADDFEYDTAASEEPYYP